MPKDRPSRGANITGRPTFVESGLARFAARLSGAVERRGTAINIRATIAKVIPFLTALNLPHISSVYTI
jgi:hypothetical protein